MYSGVLWNTRQLLAELNLLVVPQLAGDSRLLAVALWVLKIEQFPPPLDPGCLSIDEASDMQEVAQLCKLESTPCEMSDQCDLQLQGTRRSSRTADLHRSANTRDALLMDGVMLVNYACITDDTPRFASLRLSHDSSMWVCDCRPCCMGVRAPIYLGTD